MRTRGTSILSLSLSLSLSLRSLLRVFPFGIGDLSHRRLSRFN